jgi:hypothetical protein
MSGQTQPHSHACQDVGSQVFDSHAGLSVQEILFWLLWRYAVLTVRFRLLDEVENGPMEEPMGFENGIVR